MFVSGALPWDVPTPALPPLGGLLSMLDGKDGVRASLLLPPPVPRTAACVVLPQPTLSPRHAAPFTKASSSPPSATPLKFGVDRLLAAEPRRGRPSWGMMVLIMQITRIIMITVIFMMRITLVLRMMMVMITVIAIVIIKIVTAMIMTVSLIILVMMIIIVIVITIMLVKLIIITGNNNKDENNNNTHGNNYYIKLRRAILIVIRRMMLIRISININKIDIWKLKKI